jgi:hypothetical protein
LREALFIKKNKKRWEQVQHTKSDNPDDMARDFIRLVDDLAYAKTFYATSKVTTFINALAARTYLNIYQNRKEESNRLLSFWKKDLPLTIYKHRRIVFGSFILFALFFAVGFFSSQNNDQFVRQVLGNGYVDMTERNIEEGNPFGVYQAGGAFFT